jgi:hypothetical protein
MLKLGMRILIHGLMEVLILQGMIQIITRLMLFKFGIQA